MKLHAFLAGLALVFTPLLAQSEEMKLAVTTSFHNSGLAEILLPEIEADTGITVQLLVVGTGQAIRLGEAGDVDAILVHSRRAEVAFLAGGFGTTRREIMFNDFVLIGPSNDPAHIADAATATDALAAIALIEHDFVSRGDDSGTHSAEVTLWNVARGDWYKEVGAGMGATLNTASGLNAYVMADRASWLNFGNKGDLALLFSGDPVMFNQYAYLPINPSLHPHVKNDLAMQLEVWLTSAHARELINGYLLNGEQLFTFNAQ